MTNDQRNFRSMSFLLVLWPLEVETVVAIFPNVTALPLAIGQTGLSKHKGEAS
jgi:hypothetical protein